MYLFTPDELEHMTPDELTCIIDAAFVLMYGCYRQKEQIGDGNWKESPDAARVRDLFVSAIAPLHNARCMANKLNGSMLYRPMLDPLSHEDFAAAHKIAADLEMQAIRAWNQYDYMIEQHAAITRPASLSALKCHLHQVNAQIVQGCSADLLWRRGELLQSIRIIESK